ncbi:helix-turn-helix domain-containing protein [Rhodococcus sp. NPDC056960]|uniref:helix-turn-helix domain-containing protein n=1 Tax=Rhodococcus sp. NPDC056960 TaxID=3345982 RepID=UPI0036430413
MALSAADRDVLERLVAAPTTTQALALRARIVLASEDQSVTEAARTLEVTRSTIMKWRKRFDEHGIQGLGDLARPGRPVSIGRDEQRAILGVQLREPAGGAWTTRTIAAELGTSQTAVSRVRRLSFTDAPDLVTRSVLNTSSQVVLAAVFVSADTRVLIFHEPASPPGGGDARPRTSRTRQWREVVRTVLSAQLAYEPDVSSAEPAESAVGSDLLDMLERVNKVAPQDRRIITLVDVKLPPQIQRWLYRHPRFSVYEIAPRRWLAQLDSITEALDRRQGEHLLTVENQVRSWAASREGSFRWVRPPRIEDAVSAASVPAAAGGALRNTPPRLATAVVKALRESIATGAFDAGQRILEEPLAARLGVSRGPIRDALQILAEDGLVALEPHRGAYIPIPTRQDIFDTYTARGPLGALLLRRVATKGKTRLAPVEAAMEDVIRNARTGDAPATGDADIRWQDAAAHAADMPRIEKMFVRLSLQLRMFISILGLDYAYSVDDIVADDTAILDALRNQDPELVTSLWSRKIDNAVFNMVDLFRRHEGAGTPADKRK